MANLKEQLVQVLELGHLSPEEQDTQLAEIGERVINGVIIKSLYVLGEEDKKALEEMADKGTGHEELFSFLKSKINNLDQVVTEEIQQHAGLT